MGLSAKYGHIDISGIGESEPVFILRAQDKLVEATIEFYRILARSHESEVADALETEIEAFRHWQGTKKLPD